LSKLFLVCVVLAFLGSCDSYNLPLDKFLNGSSADGTDAGTGGSAKAITAFAITSPPSVGVITGTAIAVTVPYGTPVTGLVPAITHTGAGISPASGEARDFTTPVSYTVTAADGSTVTYTVTVTFILDNVTDIATWIDEQTALGYGTAANPVPLALAVNLAAPNPDGWAALLTKIQSKGKYVSLDLSACTMSGTEFNPGTANTGEKYITALTLPSAATSVRAGMPSYPTFRYFIYLKNVSGTNVTSVGDYTFEHCTNLTMVSLPAVITIGISAFSDCDSLTTVSLPAATSISSSAFYSCNSLTTIDLLTATSIDGHAFYACTNLTTVNLFAVITIGNSAFGNCTSLSSVSLPATLSSIVANPFIGCTGLTNISVDADNPNFSATGGKLMNKAGTTLFAWPTATGNVSLSATVTTIGASAFSACSALTMVDFLGATSIGGSAFFGCTNLTTVNLPEVTDIGGSAFFDCISLTTVNLPEVIDIGGGAFFDCNALTTVTIGSGCNIDAASGLPNGFKTSYDGNSMFAGTYTWDGYVWNFTP
jgi:hypothetical protein